MLDHSTVLSHIDDGIVRHSLNPHAPEVIVDPGDVTARVSVVSGSVEMAPIDNDYETGAWANLPEAGFGLADQRYVLRNGGAGIAVVDIEWQTPPEGDAA